MPVNNMTPRLATVVLGAIEGNVTCRAEALELVPFLAGALGEKDVAVEGWIRGDDRCPPNVMQWLWAATEED